MLGEDLVTMVSQIIDFNLKTPKMLSQYDQDFLSDEENTKKYGETYFDIAGDKNHRRGWLEHWSIELT